MQTPAPTPSKPGPRAEEPIDRRLKETRQSMAVLISALNAARAGHTSGDHPSNRRN